ncbi:MAG: type I restriction enzyme HsdR N-terminal domain-containing protein [Thaumarchaeota archaeon]|nr:type I restriction enzyme HsdR N-terminal domain-containing protein [Nitrososphaerota archaeon]
MKPSNNRIIDFVQKIKDFSQTNLVDSEENTKKRIIDHLIGMLGWDIKDLQLEYPISMGHSTHYVDYAMLDRGKPVLFLEAKAFSTELSKDDSDQIIKYGKAEYVRWVALTNGVIVKVFDIKAGNNEKECLVAEIDLQKYFSTKFSELAGLISKDAILTGKINDALEELKEKQNTIESLKQTKDEFVSNLLDIARKEIKDENEDVFENFKKGVTSVVEPLINAVDKGDYKEVSREELKKRYEKELKDRNKNVILCPTEVDSVDFLKEYNVWGYVDVEEEKANEIAYFALYVNAPHSKILYFGEVDHITEKINSKDDDEIKFIDDEDKNTFKPGKRLICLRPGTIVKFKDPIHFEKAENALRKPRYIKLSKLLNGKSLEDVYN